MKDLKFRVKSPQHSEAIQKRLFELGYRWSGIDDLVKYTNETLWITSQGMEIYCLVKESLDKLETRYANHTEATLDDLYSPEFLNKDTSNEDSFKKAFPELVKCVGDFYDALNQIKIN